MAADGLEFGALAARIVTGAKGIVFIYPELTVTAAGRSMQIFSVEIDGLELLPSAKAAVEPGAGLIKLPPVRIVNPHGVYRLGVKWHREECEEPVEIVSDLEF